MHKYLGAAPPHPRNSEARDLLAPFCHPSPGATRPVPPLPCACQFPPSENFSHQPHPRIRVGASRRAWVFGMPVLRTNHTEQPACLRVSFAICHRRTRSLTPKMRKMNDYPIRIWMTAQPQEYAGLISIPRPNEVDGRMIRDVCPCALVPVRALAVGLYRRTTLPYRPKSK